MNPWSDGPDAIVRVWDLAIGKEVRQLDGHHGRVLGLDVSPDGRYVLTGREDAPILWDAHTGKEIRRFVGHQALVQCVAFLPDGKRMASGAYDKTIRIWDEAPKAENPDADDPEKRP